METRCAHQIICGGSWEPPPDWGRCQECTPDAANARCPGYRPLPVPEAGPDACGCAGITRFFRVFDES